MVWLAVSILGWGSTYLAMQIALRAANVGVVAAARPLMGALLILVPVTLRGRTLDRRLWGWALAIGFLNTTMVTVGAVVGTATIGPGLSAVMVNTAPFLIALLSAAVLHEPVPREVKLAVVTGFIGVVFITYQASGSGTGELPVALGFTLLLMGAVGFASASVIVRYIINTHPKVDLLVLTGWQLLIGGLLTLPYAALAPGRTSWRDPQLWWAFLYLGLTAAGMWGWFRAVEQIGAARAGSFIFLVPVVAVTIEVLRGHVPTALQSFGILIVLVAILFVTRRPEPAEALANSPGSVQP